MEFILIKEGSTEWEFMWNWLAKHPINEGIANPSVAEHENEAWQYMGSYMQDNKAIHSFRHRNHPITKNVINTNVKGSGYITEDQIQKKLKV